MNIELEKGHIIEELKQVQDEWVLKAIKRLLGLDPIDITKEKNITESSKASKLEFLNGFKEAIEELNMVKAGKLKGISAKDLLNEL